MLFYQDVELTKKGGLLHIVARTSFSEKNHNNLHLPDVQKLIKEKLKNEENPCYR